jgi:MYXO-CTERM domain-containing protein
MTFRRLAGLFLLAGAPCFGTVLFELNISGTIHNGTSPLSNIGMIYAGSDGTTTLSRIVQNLTGDCAASADCALYGSFEAPLPEGWLPTVYSVFSVVALHDGGPVEGVDTTGSLFNQTVTQNPLVSVMVDSSVNLAGVSWETAFPGISELDVSSDIFNFFLGGHQANVKALAEQNTASFAPMAFTAINTGFGSGIGASGTIYNFTNGVANGTVEANVSLVDPSNTGVPEPAAWMLAAPALAALWIRRRRTA